MSRVVGDIFVEVRRATDKFPTWPTDPLHALAVLGEEYGELTKAVLQLVYEPHKAESDDVRAEAIQTAAMAIRFVMSLDVYKFERCVQHSQEPLAPTVPTPPEPTRTGASESGANGTEKETGAQTGGDER